jgi:UDP-3-O-[3-hydroxymyristoyl] glucosamine N-acyltransferase
MKINVQDLQKEFSRLIDRIDGDLQASFSYIAPSDSAGADDLTFVMQDKYLATTLERPAKIIIISEKNLAKIDPAQRASKTFLISKNPELAVALISQKYFLRQTKDFNGEHIHPSALIAKTAKLGKNVKVGPNAIIGENVKIADFAVINANCVISSDVQIGESTVLYAATWIGPKTIIGSHGVIQAQCVIGGNGFSYNLKGDEIPAEGNVIIEDHVDIGAGCVIENATIGSTLICTGAKIDNRCLVCRNAKIGVNAILTAGIRVAAHASVGRNFVAGGNTTIEEGITVCDNVQMGGLSTVVKDVKKPGAYGGFPLLPMRDYLKTTMTLTNLVQIRKDVTQLAKKYLT